MGRSFSRVDKITEILTQCGLMPRESICITGKPTVHHAIPEILHSELRNRIAEYVGGGNNLYSHQSMATNAIFKDNDICLATPTASGKTLVFMTVAVEMFLRDPKSRILALYPAKALIQDQLEKW